MNTRSSGAQLIPIDLEIEATARRNQGRNRRRRGNRNMEVNEANMGEGSHNGDGAPVNEGFVANEGNGNGNPQVAQGRNEGNDLHQRQVQGGNPFHQLQNVQPYPHYPYNYPPPQNPQHPHYQQPHNYYPYPPQYPPNYPYPYPYPIPQMPNPPQNNPNHQPVYQPEPNPQDREPLLKDFYEPKMKEFYDGIARPHIVAEKFEVSPALLRMLRESQFDGSDEREDPHVHLGNFMEVCDTVKYPGVSHDAKMLRLFSFTLKGRAKKWIQNMNPMANTWEDLSTQFLKKFYPPSKVLKAQEAITKFKQFHGESITDAWERYQSLLLACPQHGLPEVQTILYFTIGLNEWDRNHLNSSAGGSVWSKTVKQVNEIIDNIAANDSFCSSSGGGKRDKIAALEEQNDGLKSVMMALIDKLGNLMLGK